MRRAAVLVLLVVASSCAAGGDHAANPDPTPTSVTAVESTFPPIPGGLPGRGVASQDGDRVELYSLGGDLLGALPGMTLRVVVPGGHLYVYRYEPPSTYSPTYRVDIDDQRYVEVANSALDPGDLGIPPPPVSTAGTTVVGHWRSATPRQDGVVLAQWSGECEVPSAFFVRPGGTLQSVLGDDRAHQPSTIAMGWLPDGRALVDVWGESGCGTASPEPGRYAIDPDTLERERSDLPAGVLWSN